MIHTHTLIPAVNELGESIGNLQVANCHVSKTWDTRDIVSLTLLDGKTNKEFIVDLKDLEKALANVKNVSHS